MALKVSYNKRVQGVALKSGHFYSFNYTAYENDPNPTIIFLNSVSGIHPKTGREHRYFTAINLNYLSRRDRRDFVEDWIQEMKSTNSPKLTWDKVKSKYPALKSSIRRYFYSPKYYIRKLKKIEGEEEIRKEVVRTMSKDFSKKVKRKVLSKFKKGQKKGGIFS